MKRELIAFSENSRWHAICKYVPYESDHDTNIRLEVELGRNSSKATKAKDSGCVDCGYTK